MNINCLICTDIFISSSDIYSTPCGHIFHYHCLQHWFQNSKTCPQCRTKTNEKTIIRLYINIANSQGIDQDVTVLQHKLDSLDFKLRLKDKDIKNFGDKYRELEAQNKALRHKVKELELAEVKHESVHAALKDQIKFFKQKSLNCDKLMDEVGRLKTEMRNLENIQIAINGSRQHAEDIIRNESNVESLALLAATLKKSLVDTDRKKRILQIEFKKIQQELSSEKRHHSQQKLDFEDLKKEYESLKENYHKEVTFMKSKFAKLQSKAVFNESANNSLKRMVLESPINFNRTPDVYENKHKIVDLTESPVTSQNLTEIAVKHSNNECSSNDSPLPPSSLGLLAIQRTKLTSNNSRQNKNSIFKNRQPSHVELRIMQPMTSKSEVTYDGLGGSSKEDIFPSPGRKSTGIKRPKTSKMSSNKFKKLSADAGKSKIKMTDFLTVD